MFKIAVVGTGHLGEIHLKNLLALSTVYEVVGFYDVNQATSARISKNYLVPHFSGLDQLIDAVDVVLIATPTESHFAIAVQAIKNGKHVFIEKPVCESSEDSKKLMQYAKEAGVQIQVGHVERFNPAFMAAKKYIDYPVFIESQRLAPFQERGSSVSVVHDLMIHDIDLAFSTVRSRVKSIAASGMSVLSKRIDIASVRLEFENHCVANLTASRLAVNRERKSRFFMKNSFVLVDYLNKKSFVTTVVDPSISGVDTKKLFNEEIPVGVEDAIRTELYSFAENLKTGILPEVSILDAHQAVQVVELIVDQIQEFNRYVK